MRAIIIGAGRGRRLRPTPADTPKCYAEVQGRRLLDWALGAIAGAGVSDICFIGGYRIDKVRRDYSQFTFRHNAGWEHNNILLSLMHAEGRSAVARTLSSGEKNLQRQTVSGSRCVREGLFHSPPAGHD